MTISVRPAQFSILGAILGVAIIPTLVLGLLFFVQSLIR
jgi:hypothetical protein